MHIANRDKNKDYWSYYKKGVSQGYVTDTLINTSVTFSFGCGRRAPALPAFFSAVGSLPLPPLPPPPPLSAT
jgi:hypothetical protein